MASPRDALQGSRPSRRATIALALVAGVGLLLGPMTATAAAQGSVELTIEPRESGCGGDKTFCYEVTDGSASRISSGDTVEITFRNPSENSQDHNLHLADLDDVEGDYEDTPSDKAFESTEDLSPGNETTLTVEVPSDASGVYLWCTIRAHESLGMWEKASFGDASDQDDGSGSDEGTENSSPGFGAAAGVAAIAGLAVALKRR